MMNLDCLHKRLEELYNRYNRREFVHPDPLEFLYDYKDTADREIVGLVSSSLAYGRVVQILKSVRSVLEVMGDSPHDFVMNSSKGEMETKFRSFKHRFATGSDMAGLLLGVRLVLERHGSLQNCFVHSLKEGKGDFLTALSFFVKEAGFSHKTNLLPEPDKGSACKRLNLFLRWMVRCDGVDPGGWEGLSPAVLLIPLDTHMFNIGKRLGFTQRKHANMNTVLEITKMFAQISPNDPVKYDFALTRLGIRDDTDMEGFLRCAYT